MSDSKARSYRFGGYFYFCYFLVISTFYIFVGGGFFTFFSFAFMWNCFAIETFFHKKLEEIRMKIVRIDARDPNLILWRKKGGCFSANIEDKA